MAERDGPQDAGVQVLNPQHRLTIKGLKVSNDSNYSFNTARSNVGVKGAGKWYFELIIDTNNQMRVGWVTKNCNLQVNNNTGLGADTESWGYDGYSGQKHYAGNSDQYGGNRNWSTGDTVGCLLDLDTRKISYFINGKSLGVAFTAVPRDRFLYPAVSLRRYQGATFNFGKKSFTKAPAGAFPLHSFLNSGQKQALEKLYSHYQSIGVKLSESMEDRGDIVKADGVFEFANDVGATDDTDPLLLIVAWKLNAENPWEFTRDEWTKGFAMYGLHDIRTIKEAAQKWKEQTFASDDAFRPFYLWCFTYLLDEDRKILSLEEVETLWLMLGMPKRYKQYEAWNKFLKEQAKRTYLSRDEWGGFLNFTIENPDGVEDYDDSGSNPLLLDDFVDFLKGGSNNSEDSSD